MLKKFYIVKDYKDLTSGQVIPQKVLDYLPASLFNPFLRQPQIQPIPITKSQGIVIGTQSPSFGLSTISPITPIPAGPYATMQVSRTPLLPNNNGCNSCGQQTTLLPMRSSCNTCNPPPIQIPINRCGTATSPCGNQIQLGPPIIKTTPMIAQNVPGIVKIVSGSNVFNVNVPIRHIRDVVNDIYFNANTGIDPLSPKVMFRIITPTIDSSIATTYDKMVQIMNDINNKYSGLMYRSGDGREVSLGNFVVKLKNNIGTDGKYIPINTGQLF